MGSVDLTGPPEHWPLTLVHRYRATTVGDPVTVTLEVSALDGVGVSVTELAIGGGFEVESEAPVAAAPGRVRLDLRRARSLPDVVGPGMRMLVCGLNPSEYAADAGVGFARPGNRFWPAAIAAELVTRERDVDDALATHGLGMTDLVKRATPRADGLTAAEYRAGTARVERLVRWLRPGVVCFVGLAGWRAAVDRQAVAGPQALLQGTPVYVMPSTSGVNARVGLDQLAGHLRAAAALAP